MLNALVKVFLPIARMAYAQLFKPWLRTMRMGKPFLAFRRLFRNGYTMLHYRLLPSEARVFSDHMPALRKMRSALYLQFEHRQHLGGYSTAISALGLHDKAAFARFCHSKGLANAPTVELTGKTVVDTEWQECGPLVVKPSLGSGARDLASLERQKHGNWRLCPFRGAPREGPLDEILAGHRDGASFVLQPLLRNNAGLTALLGPSLATFRTVTAAGEDGRPEALSMLAELPLEDTLPMSRRWLILPVDMSSGALVSCDPRAVARIDDEKARGRAKALCGQVIPGVSGLAALACQAHAAVLKEAGDGRPPPMIGWDLVLACQGALLLELNWNWAVAPHYANAAGLDFKLSSAFAKAVKLR